MYDRCRPPMFPPPLPNGASTSDYQQQILTAIQLLVTTAAPLPSGAATQTTLEAVRALLAGTLTTSPVGQSFTDRSIPSLSSGQAAATTTTLSANTARRSLMINPPSDCFITLTSGGTTGYKLYGGVPNQLSGPDCPTNALYISGLATGAAVAIWEA